jgi:hypothetical protein
VSVDPSCRNRVIAKRLIEDYVSYVRRGNKVLELSRYSEDGKFVLELFSTGSQRNCHPSSICRRGGEVSREGK